MWNRGEYVGKRGWAFDLIDAFHSPTKPDCETKARRLQTMKWKAGACEVDVGGVKKMVMFKPAFMENGLCCWTPTVETRETGKPLMPENQVIWAEKAQFYKAHVRLPIPKSYKRVLLSVVNVVYK
ncbi:hypothetical protein QBC45DRAFT_433783 [Copromyces sp. CBS 386.78]|nr:hypothetical protein QBC45DRAFT_433783 [Copromyces sp. CBS 386.78]